jgi:hypothetical protein
MAPSSPMPSLFMASRKKAKRCTLARAEESPACRRSGIDGALSLAKPFIDALKGVLNWELGSHPMVARETMG